MSEELTKLEEVLAGTVSSYSSKSTQGIVRHLDSSRGYRFKKSQRRDALVVGDQLFWTDHVNPQDGLPYEPYPQDRVVFQLSNCEVLYYTTDEQYARAAQVALENCTSPEPRPEPEKKSTKKSRNKKIST